LDEYTICDRIFAKGGYAGPLCWYKADMPQSMAVLNSDELDIEVV
jgi:hypothetical protein